jgi:DnaJ-class molecular chaperone
VSIQDLADVRIIPGTQDGDVLRERGLGDAGVHGGAYGDLVVRVRVVSVTEAPAEPGEVTLDISVVEALLGGRMEIDTPRGRVRLTIAPGTSSGARLRLKGKGASGTTESPVDLFVNVRIVVPRTLDDESRKLIEEFARLNPGTPRD